MDTQAPLLEFRLRQAVEAGALGLWDLRPELETVHYSPQWKLRLGFPEPHGADSTHFWRCRVHPDDLDAMLAAMREHASGERPAYEARFRLRSNGSGYRLVCSRGCVVERNAQGRAVRMLGTMIDLTERPCTPRVGLPEGERGAMAGTLLVMPFHRLLYDALAVEERRRVLALTAGILHASLEGLRDHELSGPRVGEVPGHEA